MPCCCQLADSRCCAAPVVCAVLQLLTPSYMLSKTNGRDSISKGDLEEAASLFHDAKYSARMLAEQADKYIT